MSRAARPAPPAARAAGLRFILFAVLLDALGIGLVIPVLPAVVDALNTDTGLNTATVYGGLVGAYAFAQFLFAPLVGSLSDRFGRRPVLLVSIAMLGVNFAATYVAPTLWWLFATRLLSGATAANLTAANAYVADVTAGGPEAVRSRNFGLIGAMFGVGFVVGPALGGLLGEIDPRMPFLVAAGLCGLNVLYGFFVLPESLPPERRRAMDVRRLNPVGALVALRRYPAVSGLAAAFGLAALAQFALQSTWVLYTAERYGWGPQANGLSLMAVGVLTAAVQGGLVGRLTAAFGERRLLVGGLALGAAAHATIGAAASEWVFFAAMPLAAIGGVAGPSAQSLVTRRVPSGEQGTVQGALSSLSSLAAVVAPLTATALLAQFTARGGVPYVPGASFFAGAVALIGASLAAFVALRRSAAKGLDATGR